MKQFFEEAFRSELDNTIQDLEEQSSVELLTVIYPQADQYRDTELWGGIFCLFVALLYFFFAPTLFGNYTILFGTWLAFILGVGLVRWIKPLKRLLVVSKRRERMTEIMARAVFQKANIHRTSAHTGVLLFISVFEQKTYLLWDLGVDMALDIDELEELQNSFQSIFKADDTTKALLEKIKKSTVIFKRELPLQPNDVNELPNHIEVQL
ncbi:MAG: hypothetical protein GY810_17240 [Aureispira sp.]|nr:hypothetical protein [Aureispira sp.]